MLASNYFLMTLIRVSVTQGVTVVEGLNEVRAWELYLERSTRANDDYQKQIAQLTKKLESKFPA
jgi:hypothetical protein